MRFHRREFGSLDRMRIGIFGLGLIGEALASRCHDLGWEVSGFSRSRSIGGGRVLDAARDEDCSNLARMGTRFEAAVVTFPPQTASPLFWEALPEVGELPILLGTTSIYRRVGIQPEINEETPLRQRHPRHLVENHVQTRGIFLIRLSGIYGGPRDPRRWIESGRVGYEDRQVNLVHCEDVAAALVRVCGEGPRQPVYNLSDGGRHTWRQIIDVLLAHGRIRHDRLPAPPKRRDAFVSNRRFLGDYPSFKFRDLMEELVR